MMSLPVCKPRAVRTGPAEAWRCKDTRLKTRTVKEECNMNVSHKENLRQLAERFLDKDARNYVEATDALRPNLAGMRIYETPLVAVADACDPLFDQLLRPEVVGPHVLLPKQWMPEARSVVSFFLPFTETVTRANLAERNSTPPEWLHARIEGQLAVNTLARLMLAYCEEAGHKAMIPSQDPRFWSHGKPAGPRKKDGAYAPGFTSNWSERHAAYVCGLGTFGLSRHLITKKGTAGRFGSLLTTLPLEPDTRPYSQYDEYCTHCGGCIPRCPAEAITLREKDQVACGAHVDETMERYKPRYGCGKCSVGVPCQSRIPRRAAHPFQKGNEISG